MRFHLKAPAVGLVLILGGLTACDAPVGSNVASMSQVPAMGDYQRHLRDREGRRDIPYSVPPETAGAAAPGAPLAQPMASAPMPMTPVTAQPLPPAAPLAPAAAAPVAEGVPRPSGVSDATTYTPVPFGSRPAGAEIPPQGTTEIVTVANVPTGASSGPNVVNYALTTTHAVGTQRYTRRNPFRHMRWESACLAFVNQDAAQEAFLTAGGPENDRQNLDPDGDGFACWWDPQVYRNAARLGQ